MKLKRIFNKSNIMSVAGTLFIIIAGTGVFAWGRSTNDNLRENIGIIIISIYLTSALNGYFEAKRENNVNRRILKEKVDRFLYHWENDFASLQNLVSKINEHIRKDVIISDDSFWKKNFGKIKQLYAITKKIDIPANVNKQNYQNIKENRYNSKLMDEFIRSCNDVLRFL